jgi:hypothetical protein
MDELLALPDRPLGILDRLFLGLRLYFVGLGFGDLLAHSNS